MEDLIVQDERVAGVVLGDGRAISAGAVVRTTGTFLNRYGIGRQGEPLLGRNAVPRRPAAAAG